MNRTRRSNRRGAGVRSLPENYVWPKNFGTGGRQSILDEDIQMVNKSEKNMVTHQEESSLYSKLNNVNDGSTATTKTDQKSSGSRRSQVSLEVKRLAIEKEKKRQELEERMLQKRIENELKLLEMESELKKAEYEADSRTSTHNSEIGSRYSNIRNLYPTVIEYEANIGTFGGSDRVTEWVKTTVNGGSKTFPDHIDNYKYVQKNYEDIGNNEDQIKGNDYADQIEMDVPADNKTKPLSKGDTVPYYLGKQNPDIKLLCDTIANVLTAASPTQATDRAQTRKLLSRQTIAKDFPIFSGNPEEWPLFFKHFVQITSLCEYSEEEILVKLQHCLKGERGKSHSCRNVASR